MGLNVYAYVAEESQEVLNFAPKASFEGNRLIEGERHPNFRFSQPLRSIFSSIAGVKMEEGYTLSETQVSILKNYFRLYPEISQYPKWAGAEVSKFFAICEEKGYTVSIV